MNKEKTYSKVEKALSEGELWRAKEILQGNLASCGYDFDIFEKYGQVLLQMGDLPQAGKYLFLCGRRKESYENSIALYLNRFSKPDLYILFSTFPKSAKLNAIENYPEEVRKHLARCGYDDIFLNSMLPESIPRKKHLF